MTAKSSLADPPPGSAERARIVAAARAHFFAHGFRGVTMADLATELGMSKKTLYAHFESKDALLEAVIRDKFARVTADLETVSAQASATFSEALHDLLAAMRRQTEEVQPPFVRDLRREAPEKFRLIEGFRRELVQKHFGRLLTAGRKVGRIRKDLPVPLMVEILVATTDAVVNPEKMDTLGLTPKTGLSAVITLFLEGALTREGGDS